MRKILPYLLALFAVLALGVSVTLFLNPERYRSQIAATLSQRLKHKVVIGKIDAVYFPPSLHLQHLVVLSEQEDKPLLQIESAEARIAWKLLFSGHVAPDRLTFDHWLLYAERRADGSWDWGEWLNPASNLEQSDGWPLKTIEFENGECRLHDPYAVPPSDLVIQSIEASLQRSRRYAKVSGVLQGMPVPVGISFEGVGQFIVAPEWKGDMILSSENRQWSLHLDQRPGQMTGQSESKEWRADVVEGLLREFSRWPGTLPPPSATPLVLQNWNGQFTVTATSMTFHQTLEVASGQVENKGSVVYASGGPQLHTDLAIQNVQVRPLEDALGWTPAWEGQLTSVSQADLTLSTSPWSSLRGQGAIDISNGRYHWSSTLAKSLAKAHLMTYLKKKYPDFLENGLAVTKVSAHWQARSGEITVDDGRADFGALQAAVVGRYDGLRHGVEGYLRLLIHEKNPSLINTIPPSYVYRGNGGTIIQPMHGVFQGVGNDLTLRARKQSKMPASALSKLKKLLH